MEDEDSSDEEYCPDEEDEEDEDTVEEVIAGSSWSSVLTLFHGWSQIFRYPDICLSDRYSVFHLIRRYSSSSFM